MEKPLGEAAGLGWQGKHTNLVSREYGSWLFLGAILTAAELEPDAPEVDHCGTCSRCLDICPTQGVPRALPARCAPLHRLPDDRAQGPHPAPSSASRSATACSAATTASPCARGTSSPRPRARPSCRRWPSTDSPPLAELLALDDAAFRQRFAGTPVKRTRAATVCVRNALIAAGQFRRSELASRRSNACSDDPSPLGARHGCVGPVSAGGARRIRHARPRRISACTREAVDADVRANAGTERR